MHESKSQKRSILVAFLSCFQPCGSLRVQRTRRRHTGDACLPAPRPVQTCPPKRGELSKTKSEKGGEKATNRLARITTHGHSLASALGGWWFSCLLFPSTPLDPSPSFLPSSRFRRFSPRFVPLSIFPAHSRTPGFVQPNDFKSLYQKQRITTTRTTTTRLPLR